MRQLKETEYEKLYSLMDQRKDVLVFAFDDLLVLGNRVNVIKEYIVENPSKKFRTWLIDKGYVIDFKE